MYLQVFRRPLTTLHDKERLSDEIEDLIRQRQRRRVQDQSIFSNKDLGVASKVEVYPSRDHDAYDIQRAINKTSARKTGVQQFLESALANGFYGYLKLRKLLGWPKESFTARSWLSSRLGDSINLINPGGVVWVADGDYNINQTLDMAKDNIALQLSSGANLINKTGDDAVKVGDYTRLTRWVDIEGFRSSMIKADSGTVGAHLLNAHLCGIDGIRVEQHFDAGILFEGSWGSHMKGVEVFGTLTPRGSHALKFINTQSGAYQNHQNNQINIKQCWLRGETSAVLVEAPSGLYQPCDIWFEMNTIHSSPKGVHLRAGHAIALEHNYFEDIAGYYMHLEGDLAQVCGTVIAENWGHLGTQVGVRAENVDGLVVAWNTFMGDANSKLLQCPSDATVRRIYLLPNHLDASVTEFDGNLTSLNRWDSFMETKRQIFMNNKELWWRDPAGNLNAYLALHGNSVFTLRNNAGDGQIEIGPGVSGGDIRFYDWGASKAIAYLSKDRFQVSVGFLPEIDVATDLGTALKRFRQVRCLDLYCSRVYNVDFGGDLVSDAAMTRNIGSGSNRWLEAFLDKINTNRVDGDLLPVTNDTGNVGNPSLKWNLVRATTITPGDLVFENGWRMTEVKDGIALKRPDGSLAQVWRESKIRKKKCSGG
jgi:hypothetical protein